MAIEVELTRVRLPPCSEIVDRRCAEVDALPCPRPVWGPVHGCAVDCGGAGLPLVWNAKFHGLPGTTFSGLARWNDIDYLVAHLSGEGSVGGTSGCTWELANLGAAAIVTQPPGPCRPDTVTCQRCDGSPGITVSVDRVGPLFGPFRPIIYVYLWLYIFNTNGDNIGASGQATFGKYLDDWDCSYPLVLPRTDLGTDNSQTVTLTPAG